MYDVVVSRLWLLLSSSYLILIVRGRVLYGYSTEAR